MMSNFPTSTLIRTSIKRKPLYSGHNIPGPLYPTSELRLQATVCLWIIHKLMSVSFPQATGCYDKILSIKHHLKPTWITVWLPEDRSCQKNPPLTTAVQIKGVSTHRRRGEGMQSHPAYTDGEMLVVTKNRTLLWLFLGLKPPKRMMSSRTKLDKLTQDSRSRQGKENWQTERSPKLMCLPSHLLLFFSNRPAFRRLRRQDESCMPSPCLRRVVQT
jgi:hypothetical protein